MHSSPMTTGGKSQSDVKLMRSSLHLSVFLIDQFTTLFTIPRTSLYYHFFITSDVVVSSTYFQIKALLTGRSFIMIKKSQRAYFGPLRNARRYCAPFGYTAFRELIGNLCLVITMSCNNKLKIAWVPGVSGWEGVEVQEWVPQGSILGPVLFLFTSTTCRLWYNLIPGLSLSFSSLLFQLLSLLPLDYSAAGIPRFSLFLMQNWPLPFYELTDVSFPADTTGRSSSGSYLKVRKNGQQKNMQLVLQHFCKTSWIAMLLVISPTSNLSCNKSGC